jgi:hypothetical protein
MSRRLAALLLCSALAACSVLSPEAKVRARLIEAGLKPHMAACLAPRLVRKLSTAQLEALGRLARVPHEDKHHLSVGDLEDRLQAIDDPQVVDVVSRAALGCAILG